MSETKPSGHLSPIVSLRDEHSRLIRLAAQIAQRQGMPDVDSWRWPARIPRALRRDALSAERLADQKCSEWATELRVIADAIVSANRKAIEEHQRASRAGERE